MASRGLHGITKGRDNTRAWRMQGVLVLHIIYAMSERGWSERRLCHEAKLNRSTWRRWRGEKACTRPSSIDMNGLIALCTALQLEPAKIVAKAWKQTEV